MNDKELLQRILNHVSEKLSKGNPSVDDPEFNVYDYCGGNYDDAYSVGVNAGEHYMAREIMEIIDGKQRT